LQCYGIDRLTIENQIGRIRRQGYEMLRSPSMPQISNANLNTILESATTETIKLNKTSPVIGRKLSQISLREKTNVTLMAVVRGNENIITPKADFEFADEDILILFGKNENIESAIRMLQGESEADGFNA